MTLTHEELTATIQLVTREVCRCLLCPYFADLIDISGLRNELGRKEGRIWFAGEAVNESSLWHSCVHGAWHSGVNAAVDVCKEFEIPIELPADFGLVPKVAEATTSKQVASPKATQPFPGKAVEPAVENKIEPIVEH
jgi:hypothetical protein